MGKNNIIKKSKTNLINTIKDISDNSYKYVKNPKTDFTRNRKSNFNTTINTLFAIEGGSMKLELAKTFNYNTSTITDSGFNQQRDKIQTSAFEIIFKEYTKTIQCNKKYKGYRLLACDGSTFSITHNPNDLSTYVKHPIKEGKGHNSIHVNILFDLLNHTYIDTIIQNIKELNEKKLIILW